MSSNASDILIEKYLNGELTGSALEQFESRLQQEEDLAKRLKFHQDLESTLKDPKAIDIQRQLDDLGAAFFQTPDPVVKTETGKIVSMFNKRLSVAAGILILLTASYFIYQNVFSTSSSAELYAQYFETYPLDNERAGDEAQTDLEKAVADYLGGDYQQASTAFRTLLQQDPQNQILQFNLAQSLLNEEPPNITEATPILESLIATGSSYRTAATKWYLALTYVRQDRSAEAIPLLQDVAPSGGPRGRAATELLEILQ